MRPADRCQSAPVIGFRFTAVHFAFIIVSAIVGAGLGAVIGAAVNDTGKICAWGSFSGVVLGTAKMAVPVFRAIFRESDRYRRSVKAATDVGVRR